VGIGGYVFAFSSDVVGSSACVRIVSLWRFGHFEEIMPLSCSNGGEIRSVSPWPVSTAQVMCPHNFGSSDFVISSSLSWNWEADVGHS
jgi:hypothetical protein